MVRNEEGIETSSQVEGWESMSAVGYYEEILMAAASAGFNRYYMYRLGRMFDSA